jgi:hypothetical protein
MSQQSCIKRNKLWAIYFVFVALAIIFKGDDPLFISNEPYAAGKLVVWAIFISFLAYSLYCHVNETFFKSVAEITPEL